MWHEQPDAVLRAAGCSAVAKQLRSQPNRPVWCWHCRSWHEQPNAQHRMVMCRAAGNALGEVLRPLWAKLLPLDPADFPELSEKA